MMRRSFYRRGSALAIGVLVAAAVAGLGAQSVGAATVSHGHSLRLTSRNTTSIFFIPCPDCIKVSVPEGAHIGGTEVDAGDLIDRGGHKVGHFAIDSIGATPFTNAGPGELMLNATLVIGNDQIIAQGLEEPPLDHGIVAITGGTGRFRSARGEITFTDNQDGSTNLVVDINR